MLETFIRILEGDKDCIFLVTPVALLCRLGKGILPQRLRCEGILPTPLPPRDVCVLGPRRPREKCLHPKNLKIQNHPGPGAHRDDDFMGGKGVGG